jgi:predicted transposase YdaD
MKGLPTPHNNLFHLALENLSNARSLIETRFPPDVRRELKLETLKLEKESFVDPDLREKYSDVLYSVDLVGRPGRGKSTAGPDRALVYVLFEHKSDSDQHTVLQLLSYNLRIWERCVRDRLPLYPVLPLVVYHGQQKWDAARSIEELVDAPESLACYQVRFTLPLLDLSQLNDDQIEGTPVLQSILRLLKYGRSESLRDKLEGILRQIAVSSLPGGRTGAEDLDSGLETWIQAIGVYVIAVNRNMSTDEVNQVMKNVFPTQVEPGSIADRLLIQGREEGREEGKLIGKIQTFQELLGEAVMSDETLKELGLDSLQQQLLDLQSRLRTR